MMKQIVHFAIKRRKQWALFCNIVP